MKGTHKQNETLNRTKVTIVRAIHNSKIIRLCLYHRIIYKCVSSISLHRTWHHLFAFNEAMAQQEYKLLGDRMFTYKGAVFPVDDSTNLTPEYIDRKSVV